MKFEELQIDDRILRAVEDMGFEEASPIQAKAIPVVLEGKDIVGQAQTGTGKTAAYSYGEAGLLYRPCVLQLHTEMLCPY